MSLSHIAAKSIEVARLGLTCLAIAQLSLGTTVAAAAASAGRNEHTRTPIKHIIVIIGENRTFDHVFATYQPKSGESVWNLLSEGIINADGSRGPNFYKAEQQAATDLDVYRMDPAKTSFRNGVLPAPLAGGPKDSYVKGDSLALAQASENGLATDYYKYLITGGTGLTAGTPDTRIKNVEALPPGPFQLTNGKAFTYDSYAASPVHRFYQMWQQMDCSLDHLSADHPSGCDARLFPWVEVTVGAGANGVAPPSNFSTEYSAGAKTTGEGATSMGFYNMQTGDVPYFKSLADNYAMSDNYHQAAMGGTGANHILLGHGDAIWFSDANGRPAKPPHHQPVATGSANAGTVDEIEDPNPLPGTNNWYTEDGYGGGSYGSASYGGGSYSNCADPTQPGVAAVVAYLQSLPHPIDPHCEVGHYYLLNNYNPGYFGNGDNAFTDLSAQNTVFTVPPSSTRSIGDELLEAGISWKYYGDQWNNYLQDPYQLNYAAIGAKTDEYCNICNPFQYDTSIMAHKEIREAHIKDTANLYADIAQGRLPAVSFVKPSGLVDGHPGSSKLDLFEGFAKKIVDAVHANPELWKDTAIFITMDEGGGYYDSGYVQPLDFFGDGTRIPLIVVSPYTKPGHISHEYADHVSILKFIERNWDLPPVTYRSRDNFPNPITWSGNPYVPLNGPAIGDLFDLFDFQPIWNP
jgi:phospholipase C